MCDDNEVEPQTRRYIRDELRDLGLIGPDEFICIAQDIPPNTELPVTD